MFDKLKKQVQDNFAKLSKEPVLFYINIDRDVIWQKYLDGFSSNPVEQQGHNCNACKSFLRQWAGIVAIVDNKVVSIWDNIEPIEGFDESVKNLRDYVHSLPITDIFLNEFVKCGTDKNLDSKTGTTWNHFFIVLPSKFIAARNIDALRGEKRDNKTVLKRSLDELTIDSTETILELIAQNSLYRGKEFEGLLQEFLKIQKEYKTVDNKEAYCWLKSTQISAGLARIRNTSIGTLLIDLSGGMELDTAVSRFEKVVAPSNYKRPTSLVTPKMVEQAKEKIKEMGLMDSLDRRFATEADLNVNDILFTDRTTTATNDVFDEAAKESLVNPRTLSKIEEVTMDEFLTKIVPSSKSIEVLLENIHLNNMVTLVNAKEKESPSLFKWNNNFSWSYTGGITDSIKERVKAAGGKIDGELRVSLSWHNYDDLDLWVTEPHGNQIGYSNKRSLTSGTLDVDMNAGSGTTRQPVENTVWSNRSLMKEGTYQVRVHNFSKRETTGAGFEVEIECNGEVFNFEFPNNPSQQVYQSIVTFEYSKTKGITIKGDVKSSIVSKEKWNLKTNQFHKVNKLMLSPNHWGTNVGNKHYMFFLENCKSDETPRPFFNEFLKQDFDENRKVFEIIGSKLKVEPTTEQLSGIGFSETQKNHVIVRVEGAFKRTLKVNI